MPSGLAALLDDIAAIAKLAAASVDDVSAAAGRASAKAAGVVIDDTAVTPRYLHGFTAERELPIVRRIAVGSLRNKLLFILPAALLLSELLPGLLTPLLMLGGTYLAVEGAEKVYELIRGRRGRPSAGHAPPDEGSSDAAGTVAAAVVDGHDTARDLALPAAMQGEETERRMVRGAIRTDFILSAEIMVIALNEVADEPLGSRAVILAVVAVAITALVYGVVALIVKMDDIGLRLARTRHGAVAASGRLLVRAMPTVLAVLSTVGIVAMLWVGGHILVVGADDLGWHALYDLVHQLEEAAAGLGSLGPFLAWLVGTLASALVGLVVGAVGVVVVHVVRRFIPGTPAAHH